jgi:hypothetical protein
MANEENGKACDEHALEDMLLSVIPQFAAILERSEKRLNLEGGLTIAEVRSRLGLPASQSGD